MDTPRVQDDEVLFLTLHHLHAYDNHPQVADALATLERALSTLNMLPTSTDYTGNQHSLPYSNLVARYPHIPQHYLSQLLQSRLPSGHISTDSLLGTGRYSTVPAKRPRARNLYHLKKRLQPSFSNVSTILNQQTFLHAPAPLSQLTFALLPKSFRRLKRLVGHHLPVFTTLFDNSARYVITGSDDNLVKIWSTETAYLRYTLRGHDGDITEIVKHPTRPIIVTASSDTTLRVWDVNTAAALHVLQGGTKEVNAVQFSPCPDRPYLASGNADGTVRLWNADNFEASYITIPIPTRSIVRHATDTSQAGQGGATSAAAPSSPAHENHSYQNIHSRSQQPSSSNAQPQSSSTPRHAAHSTVSGTPNYEVLCVSFDAGATRLAVSGTDCTAHVYALDANPDPNSAFPQVRLLTSLRGHSDHIIQVAFSRSGGTIVTACRDGTARIWKRIKARLPNAKNKKQVEGMGSWSSRVLDCRAQIQADARSLVSGAASGSACGSIIPRFRRASFPVSVCAALWSRDDRYLFTASSDTKIRIWNTETGELARILEAHESEVYVLDCHPTNPRILLTAGYDGRCILWDIETGQLLRTFFITNEGGEISNNPAVPASERRPRICDGQFSCDGLSFVVSDTSGAITVFGTGSGEPTALAPEEQFFSRDCAPIRRDAQHRAVDENTQQLLHLVPKGRLCDREFRPHPPELQPCVPCVRPSRKPNPEKDEEDSSKMDLAQSSNTVENRKKDALLQRAKEFRENQEKEERRLLREARYSRRRMIIERNRANRDEDRFLIPLRDFEVARSDYEEEDEDFIVEEAASSVSDSSSSSSEDEENIVARRKRRLRLVKEESASLGRRRKRPRRAAQRRSTRHTQPNSPGSTPSDVRDESPEYVESAESESESSDSSGEHIRRTRRRPSRLAKIEDSHRPRTEPREYNIPTVSEGIRLGTSSRSVAVRSECGRLQQAISALNPASRRMKIHTVKVATSSAPSQAGASRAVVNMDQSDEARVVPLEIRNFAPPSTGANSVGSHYVPQPIGEAGASVSVPTPVNPSFTSERKDRGNLYIGRRKTLEDHQADSASCFRPRGRVMEDGNDEHRITQSLQRQRSPETEKGQHSHHAIVANTAQGHASNAGSKGNSRLRRDKSILSDSPLPRTRSTWNRRTRKGSALNGTLEIDGPVLDIDEVAERELEILDAKHSRRHRKKRRREHRSDSSGNESRGVSDDPQRPSIAETEERLRSKRQRRRRDRAPSASRENVQLSTLKGSSWLRLSTSKHTYVPQVGDDVMYFPDGHATAMEVSKSAGIDPLLDKVAYKKQGKEFLNGSSFQKGTPPVRFIVVEITYEFGQRYSEVKATKGKLIKPENEPQNEKMKTISVLTLRLISGLQRRPNQSDLFVLAYFPVDAPEYLVLTGRVEAALNRGWKSNDRFRILFLNEMRAWQYYTGTIRSVKSTVRTAMWNSVEVVYDKTESEKDKVNVDWVSPWELEPADLFQGARYPPTPFGQITRFSTVDPGLFPVVARELEAIRQIEPGWRTHLSWLDTVDNHSAPAGYIERIPYPLDLNTVLVRLCTGYYRHFTGFTHDIESLRRNAITYHGQRSEMGTLAVNVFTRIADTAERIRVQFQAALPFVRMAPVDPQPPHAQFANQNGSRTIRPRPTPGEIHSSTASAAYTGSHAGPRSVPVSTSHRQSFENLANRAAPQSQRTWNPTRVYPGNNAGQILYTNSSLGIALPPALPNVPILGASSKVAKGTKNTSHGQPIRPNISRARRGNTTILPHGHQPSPTQPGAFHVPSPSAFPVPYYAPHINGGHYLPPQVRMVANTSHTSNVGRGTRRPAGSSSHQQMFGKSSHFHRGTSLLPNIVTSNPSQQNGPASPPIVEAGPAGASSLNAASAPFGPSSILRRAASTVDGGGTHSWGRSMEGAGGGFPLQASTSDSHIPAPAQVRSPRSSVTNQGDNGVVASRTQGVRRQFHEHSTVSIVAAESTMSCGGAEFQAAESADNASEQLATSS